jgi:hypothetical protein
MTDFIDSLREWLGGALEDEDLSALIPHDDPLRMWWQTEDGDLKLGLLLEVILGGEDHLTLLALIQYARTKAGAPQVPPEVERLLTSHLLRLSFESRRSAQDRDADFHAFVSYAHGDAERTAVVLSVLREAGLKIFRDTEHIGPGDSIVGRLHDAMTRASHAILLVSRPYLASAWARRELAALVTRRRAEGLRLLPVLLDDVALPQGISDIHTIDLRGFRGEQDRVWAARRLQRLADVCLRSV